MARLLVPILLVIVVVVIAVVLMRDPKKVYMTKRDKAELVRLRVLEIVLTNQAIQNASTEPFAQIVLDEISKSRHNIEER